MQGVAGLWYPQLNPPEVLGLLAESPSERAHFADIVVRWRKARLDHELAFNRAVHAAWQHAYPHLLPIKHFDVRPFDVVKSHPPTKKGERP
jgi:integrating conjugative element protein (TIGR03759 family)